MAVKKGSKYGKKLTTKKSYDSFKQKKKLPEKEYMNILRVFSRELMRELLDGYEVNLPSRLGTLQIVKYKPRRSTIDYQATSKYDTLINHSNLHSDGFRVRLHWGKRSGANFKHKSMWAFDLSKDNKSRRELSITRHVKTYGVDNFIEQVKFKNG